MIFFFSPVEASSHVSPTVNDETHTKETQSETNHYANDDFEVEGNESQMKRIRTEEEMKLRTFDVLDEVGPYDDNEGFDEDSCNGGMFDEYDDYEDDLSENEIYAMLDQGNEKDFQIEKTSKSVLKLIKLSTCSFAPQEVRPIYVCPSLYNIPH